MAFLDRFRSKEPADNLEKLDNRSLLSAMDVLARDDSPENRSLLYTILLDVILIIPTAEIPSDLKPGRFVSNANTSFQFPLVRDARGRRLIPAFSDLEALRNWDPNTPYVGVKSVDLFKAVLGTEADEIRVNLFDPRRKMIRPGGTLTRREFQSLADGRIPESEGSARITFQQGQKIFIGVPAEQPTQEVVDKLVSTASSLPSINALFLFQVAWQQKEKWNTQRLIGIQLLEDLDASQKGEIIRQLAQSVRSLPPRGVSLDFMVLEDGWEQQAVASGKLLYEISAR